MLRADPDARPPLRSPQGTWLDYGVLTLALAVLLSGFRTVVGGTEWWITTMLVVVVAGLVCAGLRGIGFRRVTPVVLVVVLVMLTWIFVPETFFVIVPTADTVRELGNLVSGARDIIIDEQAPVGAAKPIVLVLASSFGLIVIVADWLLQRKQAAPLIGLLLLAVFATPPLVSGSSPSVWLFVAVAGLWLVLLRTHTVTAAAAGRATAPAVILGSAALAVAVLFPAVTPDVSAVATSWGNPPPTVFGRGINPMVELGQNLRRNSTVTSLTYRTTFDEAQYLKVATLRDFTGRTWRPFESSRDDLFEGDISIKPGIKVDEGRTTISIKQLRSSMLPVPYPSLGTVSGLEGEWNFSRAGMTLASSDDDSRGQTYTVSSLEVQPTAAQMRGLRTNIGPALRQYLELPGEMPAIIADTAKEVTADADTDYDRVLALQRFFRSGDFRYSETAPVAEDYDGNGVDVIAKFLEAKAGYCVHFSSAMAVMARTLRIPSRIAVGYAPGTARTVTGGTEYVNTSDDLHAWTEIFFQGVGWVRFDPTTSIGSATVFTEPASTTPNVQPTESPSEQGAAPQQRGADRLDDSVPAPAQEVSTAPRSAIVTIAVLLVGAVAPWVVRTLRRRWRLGRGRRDVEPLWRELEDFARDLGIPASAADTPRGFAARIARQPGVDVESLEALLRRVERARFSRGAQPDADSGGDLQAVIASLRAGAPVRRRLLATVLPRSLAGRAPVVRIADPAQLVT